MFIPSLVSSCVLCVQTKFFPFVVPNSFFRFRFSVKNEKKAKAATSWYLENESSRFDFVVLLNIGGQAISQSNIDFLASLSPAKQWIMVNILTPPPPPSRQLPLPTSFPFFPFHLAPTRKCNHRSVFNEASHHDEQVSSVRKTQNEIYSVSLGPPLLPRQWQARSALLCHCVGVGGIWVHW